ncbi:uncharacterized protein LOC132271735 [Cornus florida]|uniref:uncharacterized protein LOC132271735 n=1 Tax=Cornus florida TaxID=4283 RepID=UPI0028964AAE|nr:uncharacterized protein LOC132271735 [Cornus florida]
MSTFGQFLYYGRRKMKKELMKKKKKNLSASKKEVEKTVYLRTPHLVHFTEEETVWYQINLSCKDEDYDSDNNFDPDRKGRRKKGQGKPPTPIDPISKTSMPWSNCHCVALDSTIYAINEGSRICSTDAGNLWTAGRHWKLLTTIHPAKIHSVRSMFAKVVALDGKIYIFSAPPFDPNSYSKYPPDFMVAEVFDPINNIFAEKIPDPPVQFAAHDGVFAVADPSHQRILLGSFCKGVLLAYYVRNCSWEILDPQFYTCRVGTWSRPVLFDNTLYLIWLGAGGGSGGIFAYDLDRKISNVGPIIYLPESFYLNHHFTPLFFHFGGDQFYLLWTDIVGDNRHSPLCVVRCFRLRVPKDTITADKELIAYTLSEKTYLLDRVEPSMDGVVLDGRMTSDKGVDRASYDVSRCTLEDGPCSIEKEEDSTPAVP